VVKEEPERKVRKEVCGDFLRAAQRSEKERDERAKAMPGLRSRGTVRLPVMHGMWRERAKAAAKPKAQKSKESF